MLAVFVITAVYIGFIWLFFAKLRWMRFTAGWAAVSGFFLIHLLLVPIVGLRFTAPPSADLRVVQHTIQITPRLTEPTLVTEVLVQPNQKVKKGDVMFRFDKSIYQARVDQAAAQLAAAQSQAQILVADVEIAQQTLDRAKASLSYAQAENDRYSGLAKQGAASTEDAQKWQAKLDETTAAVAEAQANLERAQLAQASQIDGVNTSVAEAQANLAQAKYYLDQTEIRAPEDGQIFNLQVRPGMVAGDVRIGAIASFVVDSDRYLLASYTQEFLLDVEPGQPVEFALDLYPGQIFTGKVEEIWWANGNGQFLPSGLVPTFVNPDPLQTRFAVKIRPDADVKVNMPMGAMGAATIYTGGGGFADLGRIGIRTYSFANWLYPLPF
ncbi:HlyD family secretion protein [Neotabrizicola shimadae]|uniref:HlyD family secretion protein n=1 Tax=Neotabrizicola shimadae TaxID=2807096 RepID=A0A8G0ZXQ6_9RHOB|nr:biotin/lipoyl-binding protein [Neotabrizicola shimadae]QYZ70665.1 HlyD family secretion protein [Neotabrizicola shimadae]